MRRLTSACSGREKFRTRFSPTASIAIFDYRVGVQAATDAAPPPHHRARRCTPRQCRTRPRTAASQVLPIIVALGSGEQQSWRPPRLKARLLPALRLRLPLALLHLLERMRVCCTPQVTAALSPRVSFSPPTSPPRCWPTTSGPACSLTRGSASASAPQPKITRRHAQSCSSHPAAALTRAALHCRALVRLSEHHRAGSRASGLAGGVRSGEAAPPHLPARAAEAHLTPARHSTG